MEPDLGPLAYPTCKSGEEGGRRRVVSCPHSLDNNKGGHPSSVPFSLPRSPLMSTECASKGVYIRRMEEPPLHETELMGEMLLFIL